MFLTLFSLLFLISKLMSHDTDFETFIESIYLISVASMTYVSFYQLYQYVLPLPQYVCKVMIQTRNHGMVALSNCFIRALLPRRLDPRFFFLFLVVYRIHTDLLYIETALVLSFLYGHILLQTSLKLKNFMASGILLHFICDLKVLLAIT